MRVSDLHNRGFTIVHGLEPQPARESAAMRRTLFAGALVAISLLGDSYLYAVLPVAYLEAGVSLTHVGWLLSINRWIRFLTNPLAGVVGSRIGWGLGFAGALWLASLVTSAYGLVKGFLLLLVVRALWGLCWSFLRLGGMAAVLADSPPGRRGRLMGLFTGVFRLGSVAGVAVGGYLADQIGYAGTAIIFGVATAVGALIASLPPAIQGRWGAPGRAESNATAAQAPAGALRTHWLPVGTAEWAVSLSAAALHLVTSGLVTSTVGLLVKQRLGASVPVGPVLLGAATLTGLILSGRFMIDLLVGPTVGHWADRRGRGPALSGATVTLVLGLGALAWATSTGMIVLAALLLFAAGTGAAAILDAWAGDLAGKDPGRFLPAYSTWLDMGAATGPVVGYYLAAGAGLRAVYLMGIAVLIVMWGLRAWLLRQSPAAT